MRGYRRRSLSRLLGPPVHAAAYSVQSVGLIHAFYTTKCCLMHSISEIAPDEDGDMPQNGEQTENSQQPSAQLFYFPYGMPHDMQHAMHHSMHHGMHGYGHGHGVCPDYMTDPDADPDQLTEEEEAASVLSADQTDEYGFPVGTMGSYVPESLVFPNAMGMGDTSSDPDAKNGKKHDKNGKKDKSKKSKHKKDKKSDKLANNGNDYMDDRAMIMPQDAMSVHRGRSGVREEPFDRRLPQPVKCSTAEYDPAWHYDMKSYIRGQQEVNGYSDPVACNRPYERHIGQFPPADYRKKKDDEGPYERRLPVAGCPPAELCDPKMLDKNFMIRQSEYYRRRL